MSDALFSVSVEIRRVMQFCIVPAAKLTYPWG